VKWKNASKDMLPWDKQQVLVSVKGVYYITVYHTGKNRFELRDDPANYFAPDSDTIYWTEFGNAEQDEAAE